jgi:hypothetical protein
MEMSQEFLKREFIHFLSNTLSLMGCGEEFVQQIRQVEEKPFTPEIIDEIRKFNSEQINKVKERLALCYTTTVKTGK